MNDESWEKDDCFDKAVEVDCFEKVEEVVEDLCCEPASFGEGESLGLVDVPILALPLSLND